MDRKLLKNDVGEIVLNAAYLVDKSKIIAFDAKVKELKERFEKKGGCSQTRLLKLMSDYEAGAIDQKTYSEQEAEIMASLSKLTQQVNSQSDTSFNTGLGL